MQFHLNGFRPGDPSIAEPAAGREPGPGLLPEELDVLIVGCGPAGLTLAAQLAQFPEISTRIVEAKAGPLLKGQADGIAVRTVEVFEALGFSERVLKEAYWVNETSFWSPDDATGGIFRSGRIQDTEDGLSEFPHVILNQARVHDFLLEAMMNAPTRMVPDYSWRLVDLTVHRRSQGDAGEPSHPISATLERVGPDREGEVVTVRARYVVGCDGAHSTVRGSIGLAMRGDSANQAWGVMDVLAVTDFPDIRLKTLIRSAADGSLVIIPREGGYMTRIYIELARLGPGERISDLDITVDRVIEAARKVFRPYDFDVKEVAWWSVYEIGQRLCDRFDDVPPGEEGTKLPHVFVVGDACHTHSPKAGQGMNVAIRDAFNLGWKLAGVLLGRSYPAILHTYSGERQAVARELIDFDRVWAEMVASATRSDAGSEAVDPGEFERYFARQGRYTAGTTTRYEASTLTATPTDQSLAKGFPVGMRFHSAPVIRLADAKLVELGHVIDADGRWRLILFGDRDDPASPGSAVTRLCDWLAEDSDSPVRRYTPSGSDVDSVIDVRAVFQQGHRTLAVGTMPPLLLPRKGRYGLHDYEKVFCADLRSGRDIFDMRGIDRDRGCMVVVRPDQHVSHVLPLDAYGDLEAFFAGFMVPRS